MSDAHQTNPTEERQRRRIEEEWDEAHFGTHCVNCVPGDCPIYVLVKNGRVVREEAAGVRAPVEPGVPDMNPMICQMGLAWSLGAGSIRVAWSLHPFRSVVPARSS